MKDKRYESVIWGIHNKVLSENEIYIAIKDGLPSFMKDELKDNQEDYLSPDHEYWCDILSTIVVKDYRKRYVTQINMLVTSRDASNDDCDESVRFPRKKRVRTSVIPSHKQQRKRRQNIMEICVIAHSARR